MTDESPCDQLQNHQAPYIHGAIYSTIVEKWKHFFGTADDLLFYEALTLLALRDREGTWISAEAYPYAAGAAVAAELLYGGRIEIDTAARRKPVTVIAAKPMGDPLIDEWLLTMSRARRRASLETWVTRIARTRQLRRRIADQLCRRGILRADEQSILILFKRKVYPEVNSEPERRIVERLREAVFTEAPAVNPRTAVLLSLAKSANLLPALFGRREVKSRRERIEQLVRGELSGKAAKQAIEAMQAASAAAVVMTTIIAGASHG